VYPVISVATCAADVLKVLSRNIRSPTAVRSLPYARRNSEEQSWTSTSFVGVPAEVSNCAPLVATAPACWIVRRVVLAAWWSSLGRLQLWKVRMDSNTPPLYRRCPALARRWAVRPSVHSAGQSSRPSGVPVSSTVTCRYAARNIALLRATAAASWSGRLAGRTALQDYAVVVWTESVSIGYALRLRTLPACF